jgi:hypothetical protein
MAVLKDWMKENDWELTTDSHCEYRMVALMDIQRESKSENTMDVVTVFLQVVNLDQTMGEQMAEVKGTVMVEHSESMKVHYLAVAKGKK